jgi:hypothetical protein
MKDRLYYIGAANVVRCLIKKLDIGVCAKLKKVPFGTTSDGTAQAPATVLLCAL